MGLSRHERGLRDPNRTICPATTGQDTLDEVVLTACRHGMNEILHLQERVGILPEGSVADTTFTEFDGLRLRRSLRDQMKGYKYTFDILALKSQNK